MDENAYYAKIKELNITHYSGEVSYYTKAPLREVERKILNSLPVGSKILDLGCGSGRFSIGAAQLGHNVTGLDITPDAINAAGEKAKNLKLNNVQFLVGDMTSIPFKNNEFDFVFCPRFSINAVATFSRRKKAIVEMMRVVRSRGVVYIESFNKLYIGRGPFMPLKNIVVDTKRVMLMAIYKLLNKKYSGLFPGDIVYESNKVATASIGYAHLPTIFEIKKWLPKNIPYHFFSIPQVIKKGKFDLFKYFRYSIWISLIKTEQY